MRLLSSSGRLLLLGGLAFVGLYVYGLVMSVFDPLELVGFTLTAVGVLVAYAVHLIRFRRLMRDPSSAMRWVASSPSNASDAPSSGFDRR